ncbi:MAG: type II toxin-antitoxin system YafQ family toxin [Bacteroidales bacterium]|nr:type II toxin-antitoxin system YafQ family toxin [Bacteroidales bacterium]
MLSIYKLGFTTQFKKDYKKIQKRDIEKVTIALSILGQTGTLPVVPYLTHPLSGNYIGHLEAHIRPDLLIIWFTIENDTVKLVRLGSHAQLLGK